ncbi:unnamed protein product [Allacma fusca]|uniref:Ribonucleoside-diphosphate reductase large subunit n=1 Tax=Allacma fusca TaxID=39272 RepID=A0A8J2KEV1_9HEXA|nr:unnamed protein product [Allacma fusca]
MDWIDNKFGEVRREVALNCLEQHEMQKVTTRGTGEDIDLTVSKIRMVKRLHVVKRGRKDGGAITKCVNSGLYMGVSTIELDNLAAETSAPMTTKHPDYAILAGRIAVSNLHKVIKTCFSEVIKDLYNMVDEVSGKWVPMIAEKYLKIIQANANRLNSAIVITLGLRL